MSTPTKTYLEIETRILANFRTSFPGLPLGPKTFLGRTARAVALSVWGNQKSVEDVDLDNIPAPQSSDDALSSWAALLGLPDGQGGFGRLKPTVATGGAATLTGSHGTVYANGLVATAEDGTTQVALSGSVTIPGASGQGSIAAVFVAVTAGSAGNLAAGTVLTWVSPPAGADPTFVLTAPLVNGTDLESNSAVYARIVTRLQTPPRGGAVSDYVLWSEGLNGVAGTTYASTAYVYPRRSGSGGVDVVIAMTGQGQGRKPSSAIQTAVINNIAAQKPADVEYVNTLIPLMPDGNGHAIRVRISPSSSRYAFDWDDTAGPYTVDTAGWSSGPPATLRLNTIAPATLKAAIDAFNAGNGLAPRLQIASTLSHPIGTAYNAPITAISYADAGGKTTLTLGTVPSSGFTAPSNGDTVYAYGPAVATIAAGTQAAIDTLGASRQSGFGDTLAPWFDTLAISTLIAVAENAIDTDGTPMVKEVLVGNALIDGSAADIEGADAYLSNPEILYAKSIAITA